MITIGSPQVVAENWEIVKYAILNTSEELGRLTEGHLNKILAKVLGLEAQVWFGIKDGTDETYGIVVTYFATDPMTDRKKLIVYALYTFENPPPGSWEAGMSKIKDFADRNNCYEIIAFTNNNRLLELVGKFFPNSYQTLSALL